MQQFPEQRSAFGLEPNVAAGLAYLPFCLIHFIVSIAILATDKTNKFTRFNAVQSLLISAAMVVGYVVTFVIVMLFMIIAGALNVPALAFVGFLFYFVLPAYGIALFVCLIISCVQAFQGKTFRVPVLGNLADKWSS